MGRLSKKWQVANWVATIACVGSATLWLLSLIAPVRWGRPNCVVSLKNGGISAVFARVCGESDHLARWVDPDLPGMVDRLLPEPAALMWFRPGSFGLRRPALQWLDISTIFEPCDVDLHAKVVIGWLDLPCWIGVVATGVPAALLWWRDGRRIRPGHCRGCGYDLTGNVSGICPECGRSTAHSGLNGSGGSLEPGARATG